ncbi:MAG: hypothetical protein AAF702_43045 [Chloroflexota bacterium]
MINLDRVPQTASMNDIKNQTTKVIEMFTYGPVVLMNRATPQAALVSPKQWNALLDRLEDMQDAMTTLQAELEIATGQSHVEAVEDADAFANEIMGHHKPLSA